jgi:hypothetical protein
MRRVMILGGAGALGMRIARLVAALPDVELLIVGRDWGHATQFADELSEGGVSVRPLAADPIAGLLSREKPALLIDVSAPFRGRGLDIPNACIRARVPYIDVAGDVTFSQSVLALNKAAVVAGIPVLTGAGITPCITTAAIDAIAASLTSIDAVRIVLCPGNQHPFGPASYATFLAATGRRFRRRRGGKWRSAIGWQGARGEFLPEIGHRSVRAFETPDIALAVERFPGLTDASVHAGIEIGMLHGSLAMLSWLARCGVNLASFSGLLESLARTMGHQGTKRYVLRVALRGRSGKDRVERSWTLLADDGGHLAATPAVTLARRILRGPAPPAGARYASIGLSEIRAELSVSGLDIRMNETSL